MIFQNPRPNSRIFRRINPRRNLKYRNRNFTAKQACNQEAGAPICTVEPGF
uniref:Uncharacterized protein n=1 Tax=Rhizophora mucronata TaxID=61149 RepID=A0A2P2LRV6_RHIMU